MVKGVLQPGGRSHSPRPCQLVHPSHLQLMPGKGAHGQPDVRIDLAEKEVPIHSWISTLWSQGISGTRSISGVLMVWTVHLQQPDPGWVPCRGVAGPVTSAAVGVLI